MSIPLLLIRLVHLFQLFLLARLVLEYVQVFSRTWRPRGVLLVLAELVFTVTDPVIKPARRVIPPLRLGAVSIDLSYLVIYFISNLLVGFLISAL